MQFPSLSIARLVLVVASSLLKFVVLLGVLWQCAILGVRSLLFVPIVIMVSYCMCNPQVSPLLLYTVTYFTHL